MHNYGIFRRIFHKQNECSAFAQYSEEYSANVMFIKKILLLTQKHFIFLRNIPRNIPQIRNINFVCGIFRKQNKNECSAFAEDYAEYIANIHGFEKILQPSKKHFIFLRNISRNMRRNISRNILQKKLNVPNLRNIPPNIPQMRNIHLM